MKKSILKGLRLACLSFCAIAFTACDALLGFIAIPGSASDYEWTVFGGFATIVKYKGDEANLEIPNEFDGYPLVAIASQAFSRNTAIERVVVPEGVTTIYDSAFGACTALEEVVLPDSLNVMEMAVFSGCENLKTVNIPEGIVELKAATFNGCALTSIAFPSTLVKIGPYAFTTCDFESLFLPKSVVEIQPSAFGSCKNLKSVVFESGSVCATLRELAFCYCEGMESIVIPKSVSSIGKEAFVDCDKLTIYCEAETQPTGWEQGWNVENCPVEWGYKKG